MHHKNKDFFTSLGETCCKMAESVFRGIFFGCIFRFLAE